MKRVIAFSLFALILTCCAKPPVAKTVATTAKATDEKPVETLVPFVAPLPLAMDNLVGTWLHLNSDGIVDDNGDSVRIEKKADDYTAILVHQGTTKLCSLDQSNNEFWLTANTGEKYKITRLRSMHATGNNGIGVSLNTGIEDISLGFFQREDILKQLEGQ